MQIQLEYLYPDPDPSIKFYEIRTTLIDSEFLKRLEKRDNLPYYIGSDDERLFLGGQYTFDQIQKILRKNADKM